MRLVWVVIPLVLFGIVGVQESFAKDFLEMYCEIKKQEHISVFSLPSPREFYLYSNV